MRATLLSAAVVAVLLSLCQAASIPSPVPSHPPTQKHPKNLSPAALNEAVKDLDSALLRRKGPWTVARGKALALDDKARVFQVSRTTSPSPSLSTFFARSVTRDPVALNTLAIFSSCSHAAP